MKKLLLALVFLFAATTLASSQNITCATRPPSDSSNACASTAYVNAAIGGAVPAAAANSVFIWDGSSIPQASRTLPSGITYPSPSLTGPVTFGTSPYQAIYGPNNPNVGATLGPLYYFTPTFDNTKHTGGIYVVPTFPTTVGPNNNFFDAYDSSFIVPAGTWGVPSGIDTNITTAQPAAQLSEGAHGFGTTLYSTGGAPLNGIAIAMSTACPGTNPPTSLCPSADAATARGAALELDNYAQGGDHTGLYLGAGGLAEADYGINVLGNWDTAYLASSSVSNLTIPAGSFIVGNNYVILTVGTTDFTAIGAASNTVGVGFTATGVGTGSGTANPQAKFGFVAQAGNFGHGFNYGDFDVSYDGTNYLVAADGYETRAGLSGPFGGQYYSFNWTGVEFDAYINNVEVGKVPLVTPGTIGVTCSGTPTSSFATVSGIVTHC